jgi:hypothetical protein
MSKKVLCIKCGELCAEKRAENEEYATYYCSCCDKTFGYDKLTNTYK